MTRILWVDDEIQALKWELQVERLKEEGVQVSAVDSIATVKAMLGRIEQDFDLTILDAILPSYGQTEPRDQLETRYPGLTLLRLIKRSNPNAIVVIMTVALDQELITRAIEYGAARILTKQGSTWLFADILRNIIDEEKG